MILKRIITGEIYTNTYILAAENKEAMVIDPGGSGKQILSIVNEEGLKLKKILNTHGHCDHISGNRCIKERTGADILIHRLDADMLSDPEANLSSGLFPFHVTSPKADLLLEEGDKIEMGDLSFKVLFTPGHSPGGISILLGEMVFTGDALFQGSIGRTDLPGASEEILIDSIAKKLLTLEDRLKVYPGHGQETTISEEKKYNPFLLPLS